MPQKDLRVANRLIAGLPEIDRARLLAQCEVTQLPLGKTVYEPGNPLRRACFPLDSFISLITQVDEHADLEVGLVGSEGMLGVALVLGIAEAPQRALVQGAGTALSITTAALLAEVERSPPLRRALNAYIYVLMVQLAQSAVCIHTHVLEARLGRWLLMATDRAHSLDFRVTQEFLAYMLGVRRPSVTEAALTLQSQGLITYSRGRIRVLDRAGLEAAACGCYRLDCNTYQRVLGHA